jgi:predicted secreted protein
MANVYQKGKNLMLFVSGKSIAGATTCSLSLSMNTSEITNKDTPAAMTDIEPTTMNGTLHTENMFCSTAEGKSYYDLFDLMKAKTKVQWKMTPATDGDGEVPTAGFVPMSNAEGLSGDAYITSLESNAPNGEIATFTCDLTVTGDITHTPAT